MVLISNSYVSLDVLYFLPKSMNRAPSRSPLSIRINGLQEPIHAILLNINTSSLETNLLFTTYRFLNMIQILIASSKNFNPSLIKNWNKKDMNSSTLSCKWKRLSSWYLRKNVSIIIIKLLCKKNNIRRRIRHQLRHSVKAFSFYILKQTLLGM